MPLRLENLDETTRRFMLDELAQDEGKGRVYLSSRLSEQGRREWVALLRAAIERGDDESLAADLRAQGRMNQFEQRRSRSGSMTNARVPITAPETLAEGEFNRFYVRGLCQRALEEGLREVQVYRAKPVDRPRRESQAMLGNRVDAQALLNDLRTSQGVEPALGLPPGPNSGLSVRLPLTSQ